MKRFTIAAGLLSGVLAGCNATPADQIERRASALSAGDVMGFESVAGWSTTTPGATLASSALHTQGTSSLAVHPSASNGWTPLVSAPVSTLATISPTLAVDLFMPQTQPNIWWWGAVQMYITCPSHNIYNAYLAEAELTFVTTLGAWNTLTFPLTSAEVTSLLASGYSDLTFTVVLNVAVPTTGTYQFDNLRFLPVVATGCSGQPDGTLCDDGNACTQRDTCHGGVCTSGIATSCAAPDQCHQAGACDASTGLCGAAVPAPDWTPCSDGDRCNRAKACQGGVCTGGQPTCEDGDPCTVDSCSPSTGACQFTALTEDQCFNIPPSPPLRGRVSFTAELDNNRCVPDAAHILNRLNTDGELLGWQYLAGGFPDTDGEHYHTETIVRLPYFGDGTKLDGKTFVSAWSQPPDGLGALMGVAQLGFKGGKHGKMLATNRAFNHNWLTEAQVGITVASDWLVTPNPADKFISVQAIDHLDSHPGGAAAIGSHVVVPLQKFEGADFSDGFSSFTPADSVAKVQNWNLTNPLNPTLAWTFESHEYPPETIVLSNGATLVGNGNAAVSTAMTKLSDGRFLLILYKDHPVPGHLELYVSQNTLDPVHPFGPDRRIPDATIPVAGDLPGWQSFGIITDCSGDLYLIGTRGDVDPSNQDVVDNFKLTILPEAPCGEAYCASATRVGARKHMFCPDHSGNDQCDMSAGGGVYVDPNGQVIIYSTNYDADGGIPFFSAQETSVLAAAGASPSTWVYGNGNPFSNTGPHNYAQQSGYIRGIEFHERHGNAAVGAACPSLNDAWVEFYENPFFNNFGDDGGQVYYISYLAEAERNNKQFGANFFNDKASSVRWCIPAGSSFKVFRDEWSGPSATLNGSGQVAEIENLALGVNYQDGGGGTMNDSITSGFFQPSVRDSVHGFAGNPDNRN